MVARRFFLPRTPGSAMTDVPGSSTCEVCGEVIGDHRAVTVLAGLESLGRVFHWRCFWSVWDELVSDLRAESDEPEDISDI
jgi:hypothetical protein